MHRLFTLSLIALLGMTATVNVWGADEAADVSAAGTSAPQTSNMESWRDDDRQDNWTWFGMGYESRRSFSEMKGPAATSGGGGGRSGGTGGSGGPGGRR